jgi:hypothetical protein
MGKPSEKSGQEHWGSETSQGDGVRLKTKYMPSLRYSEHVGQRHNRYAKVTYLRHLLIIEHSQMAPAVFDTQTHG